MTVLKRANKPFCTWLTLMNRFRFFFTHITLHVATCIVGLNSRRLIMLIINRYHGSAVTVHHTTVYSHIVLMIAHLHTIRVCVCICVVPIYSKLYIYISIFTLLNVHYNTLSAYIDTLVCACCHKFSVLVE